MLEFFVFIAIVMLVVLLIMVSFHKNELSEKITKLDKKINIVYKEVVKLKRDEQHIMPTTPPSLKKETPVSEQAGEVIASKEPEIKEKPLIEEQLPKQTNLPAEEEIRHQKEKEATPEKPKKELKEEITPPEKQEELPVEEKPENEPPLVVLPNPMAEKPKPSKPSVNLSAKTESKMVQKMPQPKVISTAANEFTKPNLINKDTETSFEQQIGENWLSRIGIAILIIGIGYSVKYAIDNNWINEVGRVVIGLASGVALLGIAYFLRKSYKAFSSVLAGGAIAVFYYTITIAYQYYGMFSQGTGFGIMLAITSLGVFLALKFERLELATIALVGGFTSPFMVSDGSGDYLTFFTYIAILNVGMLALAYFKKWTLITGLAILFTFILMGGWVLSEFMFNYKGVATQKIYAGIGFSSFYYLLFYVASLFYTLKKQELFDTFDFILLLGNTVFYLAVGMTVLSVNGFDDYQGVFVCLLGVFNVVMALLVKANKKVDKNLYFLMIAKATVVISLFPLVQLYGNYIAAFWLAEVVALIWVSQQTQMKLLKHLSVVVFIVAGVSLLVNWVEYYVGGEAHAPFGNKAFAISMFALLTFIGSIYLLQKEHKNNVYLFVSPQGFSSLIKVIFGLVIYATFLFELNGISNLYHHGKASFAITSLLNFSYHFVLLTGALVLFRNNQNDVVKTLGLALMSFLAFLYLIFGNMSVITVRDAGLAGFTSMLWFALHYVIIGCIVISVWLFYNNYIKNISKKDGLRTTFYIFLALIVIVFSSVELDHMAVLLFSNNASVNTITVITHKAGYTVLWAICSFVFMYMGMKNKIQALRVISLLLFLVVILKLFLFDLYNLSELARIISFIGLGLILLVVSFMYQRLKKLIVEGE